MNTPANERQSVPRSAAAPHVDARLELLRVLQKTTGRDVAARCRVVPSRVSSWVSGRCKPNHAARRLLELNYGIPSDAWDRPTPQRGPKDYRP